MPGPGGGAHGGGGHGGGSHGGSHGGGGHHGGFGGRSFGGGMHHGPRPPRMYHGGWFRPRPIYYGGGCLSSFFGMLLLPIFIILFVILLISSLVGSIFSGTPNRGFQYDENKFQDYANTQYAVEFGNSSAYEDNILLVFLVDTENYNEYYYIGWVGDHIKTDINYMFGNESTSLGRALSSSVNTTSYKYSLDSNIAQVIGILEEEIVNKNLESSFNCNEERKNVSSHLTNKTNLELTAQTVNESLEKFTDSTGIPIVVVVDEISSVFVKATSRTSIVVIILGVLLVGVIIYFVARRNKNKNENVL